MLYTEFPHLPKMVHFKLGHSTFVKQCTVVSEVDIRCRNEVSVDNLDYELVVSISLIEITLIEHQEMFVGTTQHVWWRGRETTSFSCQYKLSAASSQQEDNEQQSKNVIGTRGAFMNEESPSGNKVYSFRATDTQR